MTFVITSCQGFDPLGLTPQPQSTEPVTSAPVIKADPTSLVANPTSTATPVPRSVLDVGISDLNGIPLRFWRARVDHFYPSDTEDVFQSLVDQFNRDNPYGISVENTLFDDYGQLYDTLQSSLYGERPDLVAGYNFQSARLDGSGTVLSDLNVFVHDPEWGFTQTELDDFYPIFWSQDLFGEKRLGIPFYRSAQVLFYNSTWGKELGFDLPPSTAQEFERQVCAAAQANRANENGNTGGWAINSDAPTLLGWIHAFGGDVSALDGSGYAFRSDQTREAFAFLHKLYADGCAWLVESRYPNAEFAGREALIVTGSLTGLPYQQDALRAAGSIDQWTVLPFPGTSGRPVILTYGPSLSILESTTEHELAAWLFIKWMVSAENQAQWVQNYGVFPSRASVEPHLTEYLDANPQWAVGLKLLPQARVEPSYPSWRAVRWALSDAGRFLFSPFFSRNSLPALMEELDLTAGELHSQLR